MVTKPYPRPVYEAAGATSKVTLSETPAAAARSALYISNLGGSPIQQTWRQGKPGP